MALTDEQKAKIKEELFPDRIENKGRGRPAFAAIYDVDPATQSPKLAFDLRQDLIPHLMEAIGAMKEGVSYRQASGYLSANVGFKFSHELARRVFMKVCEIYPEWGENRKKAHGIHGENNAQSPEFKDKKKQAKLREKTELKRQIKRLSDQYAALQAQDKVKKGELPEDALVTPTKYLKEDGTIASKAEADLIKAEEEYPNPSHSRRPS